MDGDNSRELQNNMYTYDLIKYLQQAIKQLNNYYDESPDTLNQLVIELRDKGFIDAAEVWIYENLNNRYFHLPRPERSFKSHEVKALFKKMIDDIKFNAKFFYHIYDFELEYTEKENETS